MIIVNEAKKKTNKNKEISRKTQNKKRTKIENKIQINNIYKFS